MQPRILSTLSRIGRTALACLALAALAGCVTAQDKPQQAMPVLTPPQPVAAADPVGNPGSLFSDAEAEFLFSDNRARRLGDIVLVNIVENSSGTNKADTTAERSSDMELGVSNFFNQSNFGMPLGLLSGSTGSTPLVAAGTSNTFDGTGETTRESDVSATVASRIVGIMPGGIMQIEGARQVRVNEETQILVVRGLIRARDIGSDNTVSSNKLADAQIEYYGEGVLADKQRPGWLSRVLDNVWPF